MMKGQLEELLLTLRKMGVSKYESEGLKVEFGLLGPVVPHVKTDEPSLEQTRIIIKRDYYETLLGRSVFDGELAQFPDVNP